MANTKVRDAYVVIALKDNIRLSQNDVVTLDESFAFHEGRTVGVISNFLDDALAISEGIQYLRDNLLIPAKVEWGTILGAQDIANIFASVAQGTVVYTKNDLAVIYLGVRALPLACAQQTIQEVLQEKSQQSLKCLKEILSESQHTCAPEEREESSTMDNLFGNMGFGKLHDCRFKLSMNGIAVAQPNGHFVVYNKDNNEFVDVSNTLFDFKDALFLLPAVEVNVGDTILHENKPYYIVNTTNEIKAVSYEDCTQTVLIPKSTMFGIKYFNKIFSMFGDNFAATGDLFSNPMMLMALLNGKDGDLSQLLLLNSMSNGDLNSNPMALAMLLKGGKGDDSLSTIALMSMFNNGANPFAPKKAKANTTSK